MPVKKAQHTGEVAARFLAEVDRLKKNFPDTLERIKIDASYVSQIRSGKRRPTVDHLVNICREFGCSGTWLLTGTGDQKMNPESISLDSRLAGIESQLSKLATSIESAPLNQGNKKGNNSRKTGTK